MPKKPITTKLIRTRDEIMQTWQISKAMFYHLVEIGAPFKKLGGEWYAHFDVVEEWFQKELRYRA